MDIKQFLLNRKEELSETRHIYVNCVIGLELCYLAFGSIAIEQLHSGVLESVGTWLLGFFLMPIGAAPFIFLCWLIIGVPKIFNDFIELIYGSPLLSKWLSKEI